MSTTTTTPPAARPAPLSQRPPGSGFRRFKNRSATVVLTAAMVLAMIPLVLIIFEVTRRGIGVVNLDFFTQTEPPPRREGGGYAAGFVGTLYIMALAVLMSIPFGIATAVYIVEYGPNRLTSSIRFFTDVMTGIPSIFVGLFVYGLLVIGWGGMGFGTFVGAVAIAVMMLPIVTRSAEEMLRLVPNELRNASYGLGARKWQTIVHTVLPAAAPGLTTGSMLAIARGIGETAPLLLTAFGSGLIVTAMQGAPQGAVPMQLYRGAGQPFEAGIDRAWGAALCLFVLVVLFTIVARWIGSRASVGSR
ncbi:MULTISPECIES: phosphate ABC transporter permease PstA [Nocardiopsidaceae]|uniref:Phosphate transport system permease protein PstA n=1 Tax=Streptomonospora nanhaiensis TaxID=1323731 RepID=A0ABY6YN94_9ACTN|nr:phosphate ABC transporter permease PstA [Streptomonospora nanhaiensis]WAE73793.1 phosphate ABC transporter permease PstA [Streptomonospora nanhaiensis]